MMSIDGRSLSLTLEYDDGSADVEVTLPAVLSVAERLCEPAKVPPDQRATVAAERIRRVTADQLGSRPVGGRRQPDTCGCDPSPPALACRQGAHRQRRGTGR